MMQVSPRARARLELIGFAVLIAAIWLLVPITSNLG